LLKRARGNIAEGLVNARCFKREGVVQKLRKPGFEHLSSQAKRF
jgi:hypothetical protein